MSAHWGGPVRYIDTSRQTPFIVLDQKEIISILKEINNKLTDQDLKTLFEYLKLREIVDIVFK